MPLMTVEKNDEQSGIIIPMAFVFLFLNLGQHVVRSVIVKLAKLVLQAGIFCQFLDYF
jgi:hypothetical protein